MPRSSSAAIDEARVSARYTPYAQLVRMLLPSAGSMAVYDAGGELLWCSDGYERPDLRELLDGLCAAGSESLAGRGAVQTTSSGVTAFVAALRADDSRPLGSLVLELGKTPTARTPASMVVSLLRPVLDCLESRMSLERTVVRSDADDRGGVDLLLTVDEDDEEDATALEQLLRHCVTHLGCVMGALLVPDKNLAVSCAVDDTLGGSQVLDRTQKHLLAWAQLNNRPMVVNRVARPGDAAPYKILSCPVRDPHDRVMGLIALFRASAAADFELRDIRILEFVSRKAVDILQSEHDGLTGLVNRLIFERRAQRLLDSVAEPHALLYVDVDKLQAVNDAFGLGAGDEVIRHVGEIVREGCGQDALACRIDGDRFAVLLPRRSTATAAEAGECVRAAARLGYVDGAVSVPVSVSIGVIAARPRERIAHVLASGELACKRAKREGRNRVAIHDDTGPLTLQRQVLASATLQEALKGNDFRLDAQPIVGLRARSGETVGYELLLRMRSAAGELLAPDKFLDAAERYDLLPALDRWVVCSAIESLRAIPDALADSPHCFMINVSAQSLATRKYASFVVEQLAQAGLPCAAFCFELKESAAVAHLAAAEELVRTLTSAGCRTALDNFGRGLSSLAHLQRLPVTYLKIDGRFVRRVCDDRVAESIVSGIAKAARTLGVSTIAEHVESASIAERLCELDVSFGQGFHLGRPEPFDRTPLAHDSAAPRLRAIGSV